jgi:DolP-mannose mannosyltransferase
MAERASTTEAPAASFGARRLESLWSAWVEQAPMRRLAIMIFIFGATLMLAHRPWRQMEVGDSAIYDYIAQAILRGQMPYRDVIDPKAPASMYLSAAAMAAGKLIHIRDVYAVRGLHVLLVGWLAMMTYLVAEAYLHNRVAAIIAGLVPLMRPDFATMMTQGTQPKLSMLAFGMTALLFIAKNRPFWAGFASMLACLCWQPGLMFTGAAVLIFSRYLTNWRDHRALKVMAGAAVPLAVTALYFYLRGALGAMVEWTLIFPYSVFAPHGERSLAAAFGHLWKVTWRVFEWDVVLVAMSVIGLLMFAVERLRAKRRWRESLRSPELFKDAVLMPPVVYLLFCLVNMQGGVDLIPFLPFVGIFGGWLLVEAVRMIGARRRTKAGVMPLIVWVPRVALLLILMMAIGRAAAYRLEGWSLQYQDALLKQALAGAAPDDRIYVHATAEILLLLNRPNLNPYISFDSGADDYVGSQRAGGFASVIEEMEAQAPKFVAISRLRNVTHRDELEHWVAAHYEKLPVNGYDIYIRKGR